MTVRSRAHAADASAGRSPMRAAQYVRVSTEHQNYSTANQAAAIALYAERRGYSIVRTYADEGKSGLSLGGRSALRQLLADVGSGRADYGALLVYDISRWGRFQDPDEAASCELTCRKAGVAVHYCAEQFENDGSIGSSIIKTVKRAMAGEYSRELSVKVFAGQANLIRLGFRQGGPAGFGLRRLLVDADGNSKQPLGPGEQKSIMTDRVLLIPGPAEEVALVAEIYRLFVEGGVSEREIARLLNDRGIATDLGRPWTRESVRQLLINEKYIGNNVWGRVSKKLMGPQVANPREDWIRSDGVFEPIVDRALFDRARAIIAERASHLTDEEMLAKLREILARRGDLSDVIIDEAEDAPSCRGYSHRFGGLLRAYSLIGFLPRGNYGYLEIDRRLRQVGVDVGEEIRSGIEAAGGQFARDARTGRITINEELSVSLLVVRCRETLAGSLRWRLRPAQLVDVDLTIIVRMAPGNFEARDYYLLPRQEMRRSNLRVAESNGLSFDAFRFATLDPLFRMAARAPLTRAA